MQKLAKADPTVGSNNKMYYVYVLKSGNDGNFYTGYTNNLKERYRLHKAGKVNSTKHRGDLSIVYFEGCLNQFDAIRREKYLKSGRGKYYLKSRLKFWLMSWGPIKVSG